MISSQDSVKCKNILSVTELVEQVLDKTGYREMLHRENSIESESRLENIEEFLSVTEAFEKRAEEDDR